MSKAGSGIIRGDTEMEHFPLSASGEFTTQRTYWPHLCFRKPHGSLELKLVCFRTQCSFPRTSSLPPPPLPDLPITRPCFKSHAPCAVWAQGANGRRNITSEGHCGGRGTMIAEKTGFVGPSQAGGSSRQSLCHQHLE